MKTLEVLRQVAAGTILGGAIFTIVPMAILGSMMNNDLVVRVVGDAFIAYDEVHYYVRDRCRQLVRRVKGELNK